MIINDLVIGVVNITRVVVVVMVLEVEVLWL